MPRFLPSLLAFLLTGTSAVYAAPASIVIGTAAGIPGAEVTVSVTLDPADQLALGARNDIEIDPLTPVRRLGDGTPDCVVNPTLAPIVPPTFICLPTTAGDCGRLRAIVARPLGGAPLPPGLLYSCTFTIDPNAPPGGTVALDIFAAVVFDARRNLDTIGQAGLIRVLAPPATPTPPPSPTPTATGTASFTSTPLTPIPTSTPTATPTSTPTPAVIIGVIGETARPGTNALLVVNLTDRISQVSGVGFDLLLDQSVFDLQDVDTDCATDTHISNHTLSVIIAGDSAPPDPLRVRFVLSDTFSPPDLIGGGPIVRCMLPVREDAPAGTSLIALDRVVAGDTTGSLLFGVAKQNGEMLIDSDAPIQTVTATPATTVARTETPTVVDSRSATPTGGFTLTPSPPRTAVTPPAQTATWTATAPPSVTQTSSVRCTGDCDGNGSVNINELVQGVAIALGEAPATVCSAGDPDADGTVSVAELVAAVSNALGGCT